MPPFEIAIKKTTYKVYKALYENKENGIQVREAVDLSDKSKVAVKFLPWPSRPKKQSKFHQFLMDEINAMNALKQYVGDFVQLLNYDEKMHRNGTDWAVLVMPLYKSNLKHALKRLAADREEAKDILGRLAVAVQFMHQKNVIHRDLKLANVCIDNELNPYIVDFGHATMCSPKTNLSEYPIGTRGCRCPEYVRNYDLLKLGQTPANKEYNAEKFDVFSLGVIFFQVLSGGRQPFKRAEPQDPYYCHIMSKDFNSFWAKHEKRVRKMPADARHLIQSMMTADPSERFSFKQVVSHKFFNDEEQMSNHLVPESRLEVSSIASSQSNFSSENLNQESAAATGFGGSDLPIPSLAGRASNKSTSGKKSLGRRFFSFMGLKSEKPEA